VLAQTLGGGGPASNDRATSYLLTAAELPDAGTARYLRGSPPVDLGAAERLARASFGQIPVPEARDIATWRRSDTGHEVSEVVLVYDDPAQAARLDALAVSMLPGAIGLQPTPIELAGAQDARLWRADNYQAVTFRRDGVAVFIGTTETADTDAARRLAEAALTRVLGTEVARPTSS